VKQQLLLFNVDVSVTLYSILATNEGDDTMALVSPLSHQRNNETWWSWMTIYSAPLWRKVTSAVGLNVGTAVQAFSRLYKDGTLYHSAAYDHSEMTLCVPLGETDLLWMYYGLCRDP